MPDARSILARFRKRACSGPRAGLERLPRSSPLEAVPAVLPRVEAREDAAGLVQVRMELEEKSGIKEFLARKMGLRRAVRVNLDQAGSFFWKQVDGASCLHEIARKLSAQFSLGEEESRKATVMFTRDLMLRGLIHLEIPIEKGRKN